MVPGNASWSTVFVTAFLSRCVIIASHVCFKILLFWSEVFFLLLIFIFEWKEIYEKEICLQYLLVSSQLARCVGNGKSKVKSYIGLEISYFKGVLGFTSLWWTCEIMLMSMTVQGSFATAALWKCYHEMGLLWLIFKDFLKFQYLNLLIPAFLSVEHSYFFL